MKPNIPDDKKSNICEECGEKLGAWDDCDVCGGWGEVEDDEGGVSEWVKCWQCEGDGEMYYPWLCPNPYCDGKEDK